VLTVTVPDDDLMARLADLGDRVELVRWDLLGPLDPEVAARVDAVVIGHYWVQPERWRRLTTDVPALRYVFLPSAGFEHALSRVPAGVTVCNGRGVHSAGTAELAVGLILASQRGLVDAIDAQREHRWWTPQLPSLADRRVLVVGAGSLGRAVAERLGPFEVRLTQVARSARADVHGIDELHDLLPEADIVVLTVPLDEGTAHLIDAAALAAMPDGALLVNVARGRVVDTEALLVEVRKGRLRAALDVTDPEPLPADHPLWSAPGVIITAHQGGNSDATAPRVAALVRRQIEHLLAGEPVENVVART
jgi:phosphoglycerate dehydrogenase-like enzyme